MCRRAATSAQCKAAAGQARSRLHAEGLRVYWASVNWPFMMAEWPGNEQK